jgi:hypothetical protein
VLFRSILEKHKPVIYFHIDENYFPCNADFFIQNSHLLKNNKIIDENMNQTKLYNISHNDKFQNFDNTFIQPFNESVIYGFRYNYEDSPLYYYLRETEDKLYIYFLLFFGYNGTYNILNLMNIGHHYNDVEHFTYEINKNNGSLERIFFSAHGKSEGIWKYYKDLEFEEPLSQKGFDKENKTRPIIYCAKFGHGFYPRNGCIVRMFGFGNDLTNKGFKFSNYNYIKILKQNDNNFNPELYGWFYSNVKFGVDGTTQIYKRNYLLDEDKGSNFQTFIPEYIFDITPNIVILILILILLKLLEIYFNIKDRTKKTLFIIFVFSIFIFILKYLKEVLSKI